MKRTPRALRMAAAAILMVVCLGCGGMSNYTANRLSDLTDVACIDVDLNSYGLLANAGPLMLGARSMMDIPDGPAYRYRLGLGGLQRLRLGYRASGLIWPIEHLRVFRRQYGDLDSGWPRPRQYGDPDSGWFGKGGYYWDDLPAWGSFGGSIGIFLGVGVHVDVVELADFALGFFGADIVRDDLPLPRADEGPGLRAPQW
jgi:hypothetical protein